MLYLLSSCELITPRYSLCRDENLYVAIIFKIRILTIQLKIWNIRQKILDNSGQAGDGGGFGGGCGEGKPPKLSLLFLKSSTSFFGA